ncbi:MAG: WYL domain-containing protein [Actinomycetota bacterium]|nr:WYL domain-containing protein [Actinomycetota bacterium]
MNKNPPATTPAAQPSRPPAWDVLEQALTQRRTVRARYHGHERLLCPHTLGWKNGRAKTLAYQASGTTSAGTLPPSPRQRWRSMFIDDIEDPTITDHDWQTADNYTADTTGIDTLIVEVS